MLSSGVQRRAADVEWDASQRRIIQADASERMVVDAGPGTGKTAVACARLGHLIETGAVLPSQVWMVSFTRTAIAEIRSRLHSHVGDAASAVKVATVDAHAWTIHSGYDPKASLTGGYEHNLKRVIELLSEDDEVADYLQNVEHLVVDEAQDLVGLHAELIERMVERLSSGCGVTIFADEAQAIYGWSEEAHVAEDERECLLERLRRHPTTPFRSDALQTIHRTSAPGLRRIFSEVRTSVLTGSGAGLFARIREAVSSHADSDDLERTKLGIDGLPAGTLVLFRRRSEALEASQFCKAPHSLRLSGYGANLPPWLAACFFDQTARRITPGEFADRWQARVTAACMPEYGPEDAWRRLARVAGAADGSIDIRALRSALSRRAAPLEFATPEFGLGGPVIGTIHASKGREADSVLLLMPVGDEFRSEKAEEEETRVLFVGSTRARVTLRVGSGNRWPGSSVQSGRCYRTLSKGAKPAAMVEIGRPEDLNVEGLVGIGHQDAGSARLAQDWLLARADQIMAFGMARDAEHDWNWRLSAADEEVGVGLMSPALRQDLWEVARRLGGESGGVQPPLRASHIRALGCRAMVVGPDDPVASKLHAPWNASGFLLAPRLATFTRVGFWRRRG